MRPDFPPDETLWQLLKLGDENAFSTLFERYYHKLTSYGNSLMDNPEWVKDCVQDVFVDLWLYRNALSETKVVKAYLLASTRKRISRMYERDRVFRQITHLGSVEFSVNFTIEDQLIDSEDTLAKVKQLNKLINSLPARQKEALYLRFYQGLNHDQIAEMLQINTQSVSNLLHRAIVLLRKEWKGDLIFLVMIFKEYTNFS